MEQIRACGPVYFSRVSKGNWIVLPVELQNELVVQAGDSLSFHRIGDSQFSVSKQHDGEVLSRLCDDGRLQLHSLVCSVLKLKENNKIVFRREEDGTISLQTRAWLIEALRATYLPMAAVGETKTSLVESLLANRDSEPG